jgi:hypothetical protein
LGCTCNQSPTSIMKHHRLKDSRNHKTNIDRTIQNKYHKGSS